MLASFANTYATWNFVVQKEKVMCCRASSSTSTHAPLSRASLTPSLAPLLLCPSPISQDGNTALMLAAKQGEDECVKLLLEAGCDKEAKDKVHDEWSVVVMTREIVVLSCNG